MAPPTSSSACSPATELLAARWRRLAEADPDAEALVHLVAGEPPVRWRRGPLWARAERYAAFLAERGVLPGSVCAIVVRHHAEFAPLYMGISIQGAIPAVLAYPNARLHPDKFRLGLEGIAKTSGLDWIVTEAPLEPTIRPLVTGTASTVRGILLPFEEPLGATTPATFAAVDPSTPCLLQHSSGTTGLQKAVALSHAAVLDHVRRYAEAIAIGEGDRIVSWLPLYHDMGLIAAFHLPLALGIPTVQLDPFEWVSAPVLLLEALARERGTITWLPNFALNLLADRVHDDDLADVRLDHVRLVVNCSEPVRAESHARLLARFESIGLREGALAACYAMAETVFAVTQTRVGASPTTLLADRAALAAGAYVPASEPGLAESVRACVSSGVPIAGCTLRIVGPDGDELPDDRVGEIHIRSATLFDGYRGAPQKTAAVLRDGTLASGDLGFVHDGELFVVGRTKDLIIVAGKNLYPEDIEDVVGAVDGVLAGRVCAFAIDDVAAGTEKVCVVAETEVLGDAAAAKALRLAIRKATMAIDVSVGEVVLVPPRWLVKSSSGKPSRSHNRERTTALLTEGGLP